MGIAMRRLVYSFILRVFIVLFATFTGLAAALAETVNWNYPGANVNILAGSSNTTVNGVVVTTSAAASGSFTTNSAQITPAASSNGSSVGIIQLSMDATTDNLSAFQTVTVNFTEPVYNLAFTVLDIDGGPTYAGQWNDIVDFNSNNGFPSAVVTNAAWVSYNAGTGRATTISNQNAVNGNANQANGNIRVTYAGPVTSITIRHYAADASGVTDPAGQVIFIDDFTFQRAPRVAVQKSSTGGTGSTTFNFDVSNSGAGTTATTVATSGAAVTGTTVRLNATSTATTITETGPAGWAISPATSTCTDANSANSGNPASFAAGVSGLVVTVPATNIRPGAELTCAITNAKLPTVTLTKISNGGVGGFTFTGNNGWVSQTITTVTSGTGVAGATQTLTAVSTATTITEAIPAGYLLASVSCTGLGTGGTATPNLSTGAVAFDAAATAPGSNIACTFTNTKLPTVTLTKVSNGDVGAFTFNGTNGFGAAQTITTVTSGTGVAGATRALAAAATATTVTESIPAGYTLASITCTGLGTGGTFTPNLGTGAVAFDAAATAAGSNIACTFTNTKRPTVTLTKVSNGDVGGFTFTGTNGWASQTITTVTSGTGVAGATQTLTAAATATTITEGIPAGYTLASVSCTGLGTGGTFTPNLGTGAVAFDAAATAAGSNIACTFTNTKRPTVTVTKVSNGGVGGFTFTGTNGWASQTITTVISGVGVAGATQTLTAASTATTITEGIPAGYALTSVSCTGLGTGGTATPNLSTGAVVFDAAATAAGSNIACTFTNTKRPTVTLTKVSNGGVGPFTYTGTNGWASQTITTVTSGTGVTGATQTLTSASTATTITETIPTGYLLSAVSCTGLGTGGTFTPNLSTGAVDFNAAATAAGSNIACTFTNTKLPTVTLTKISNGGVGGFTFTGNNGWASQTITTVTSGTGVTGATQALAAPLTSTTITESIPAGYALTAVTCTGLGTGGTFTPNLAAGSVVFDILATSIGSDIACTFTNTKRPTVTLTKVSNGGVGGFTFTGNNGWASQTITTVTSGTGVAGATQILTTASTATTITEGIPAGYVLASVTCTGLGTGGTFTPNLSTGAVAFDTAATAAGSNIACTFTNTKLPTVTLTKVSNGGVGGFTFTGTNGWASQTITTVTSGTGVAGANQTLTAASTATTITEGIPAGYALASVTCTGLGTGGTFTPNLSTGAVAFDTAATAAGSNIACTFTNTKLPTVTLTKVSNGGVGGFTFTGTNGWTSQTITTVTSGTGVAGATQTLTAAATATTITEGIPAGYVLASVTCTGLGTGGTFTPNLSTGAVAFDSAATAAGSNIACTFTNTKLPTVTLTKVSNGGVGGFTFNGDNGFGAAQTITTVTSGTGVSGALRTLAASSTITTITESIPAGYALASATCSGMGTGGTATPNLATGALVLNAAATSPGSNIACTFTNTKLPTVTLTKVSNGGVGGFTFTGNNGWASQTITTVTSGTGVVGVTQTLTAASTSTTITEGIPAGYALASVTCTGLGTGGTFTPNLSTGAVAFDTAATAAGSNIACTFTNTKLPTVTLTKVSNGDVGGFTFTGTNGWSSQTITTVTSGTGVAGAAQTLTAASTATTITEGIPAGYALASVTCTGLGTGGAFTPNLSTGAVAFDAAATAAGSNIACTFTNTKRPTVTLTKVSNGGVGGFTFTGTNGWSSQTITTVTSGTGVAGAAQTLTAASTATTVTEGIPAGYALASVTCTGLGTGGTFTPNLSTGAVAFDTAATAAGSNIACTFTNTKLPTVTLTKVSNGDVGPFTFNGTNGFGAAQTITTVTSGTGVSGATRTLTAASTATTITETIPAGYALASATCAGMGTGGTATPNLATGALALNAAATAPGSDITCTFTNTKLPTVTLTKVSNGGVGGFTFTGTNGWASQTITTVTSGTGVVGAAQTLTAASTATTITEGIPAGYDLASVICTGLGTGGTFTPNLSTGAVAFDAAATAAGSNIACTFTNTRLPTITLTKISNGDVGPFTFNGNNGFGAAQTITTVTSGTGVSGATRTLTAASTATTITESIPAGYALASATCAGMGTGGTATPNLATGALALNAAATAPGSDIVCTFTNTKLPTVTLTKVSNGGVGGFTFTGTNGWASQTITTVTSGTGVAGSAQTLTAASTATTITEGIPAGYTLASITCTGLGTGGTFTPNLATGAVAFDTAATAAGSNIACTFTNTKRPTITLTKISNGGVGGFTFTGTNGWASQTITTVTSGSGVTGATQTLTAVSTSTTITEGIPAGYALTDVTCTGLGTGGSFTPDLATGAVAFDAAATAAGANIACTFTNGFISLSITKSQSGGPNPITANNQTVVYTINVANTGGAPLSNVILTDTLTQGASNLTLTAGPTLTGGDTNSNNIVDVGETWVYSASYLVTQAIVDDGTTLSNTASVDTDQTALQTSAAVTTPITRTPDLSVVKTADTAGPLVAGQTLTFSYLVTNTGNVTLTGVAIDETAFNGTGGTGALTPAGGAATLAPGATTTFTASYTVTQNDVDLLQ